MRLGDGHVTIHRELRLLSRGERLASPPVQHSGTANPARILSRAGRWLGDGRIEITGDDVWTHGGYDRELRYETRVLDTRTWRTKLVP